jgi:hypothetical protein
VDPDASFSLLPVDPEIVWVMFFFGGTFVAIGLAMIVSPSTLIRLQVWMLELQRRLLGGFTVDWHLQFVRNRAALWVVRLMGVVFALCGFYLLASAVAALRP